MARKTEPTKKTTRSTKPVRRTAPQTTTRSAKSILAKAVTPNNGNATNNNNTSKSVLHNRPALRVKKLYVVVAFAVVILLLLLWLASKTLIAAWVNGQPVWRAQIVRTLEQQGGKQALDSAITQKLILQEANKKNVTVSDKEVDNEINKIKDKFSKQGQNLDQVLAMQGMTMDSLKQQIKLQKLIEKMIGKDVKVSDKEVTDYIDKNKDSLPEGTKPEDVKDRLYQEKLNEKFQSWLSDLKKNAKVTTVVNY